MTRLWSLPLTYAPKIPAVKAGTCRQTIRVINKTRAHPDGVRKEVGDLIRFFAWTGKPYRSKREWVVEGYQTITRAYDCKIFRSGITIPDQMYIRDLGISGAINWYFLDDLAKADGIVPPTGEALRCVLMAKNRIPEEGVIAQVLRW